MTLKQKKSYYFKILGLPENSSFNEIKSRYRELAKIYHPDINHSEGAEEKFKEINEAFSAIVSIKENNFNNGRYSKKYSKKNWAKQKDIKKEIVIMIKKEIRKEIKRITERATLKTIFTKKNNTFKTYFSQKYISKIIKKEIKEIKF